MKIKIFYLLVAFSIFARQPPPPKTPEKPSTSAESGKNLSQEMKRYPLAYNAPAAPQLKDSYYLNVFGSFIYWYASEDSLDLGSKLNPSVQGSATPPLIDTIAHHQFSYSPGFKLGIGLNTEHDGWMGSAEYTQFYQTTQTTQTTSAALPFSGNPYTFMTHGFNSIPVASYTKASSTWQLHINIAKAVISRPFYQSPHLIILPYGGLEALLIRQRFDVQMNTISSAGITQSTLNSSQAWSLGPVIGAKSQLLLGYGLRLESNTNASLLYTRFNKITSKQTFWNQNTKYSSNAITQYPSQIRPTVELGLGMGWGYYFGNQRYHFDCSASYDFQFLPGQNMMVAFILGMTASHEPPENLYLHGLTISGGLDF